MCVCVCVWGGGGGGGGGGVIADECRLQPLAMEILVYYMDGVHRHT